MRLRFRISLRLFFASLIAFAVFFAIRYEQRSKILETSQKIEELGGRVIPAWQNPKIQEYTQLVPRYYSFDDYRIGHTTATCGRVVPFGTERPSFGVISFLLGANEDIAISAISIPANLVSEDTVSLFQQLGSLNTVILIVDENYLSISQSKSERVSVTAREKDLKELYFDSFIGNLLIRERLPNIAVYFRTKPIVGW